MKNINLLAVTVEDDTTAENPRYFYEIFWNICQEIFGFFKYIFYDVFLGKAP